MVPGLASAMGKASSYYASKPSLITDEAYFALGQFKTPNLDFANYLIEHYENGKADFNSLDWAKSNIVQINWLYESLSR